MDATSLALFALLIVLLLSSVPISIALGLTSVVYIYFFTTLPMTQIPDVLYNGINSFPLMAIPFFVLAANLMTRGGISRRLVAGANAVVGRLPGGLGVTAALSCVFFAAISGSSAATVVAVGTLLIPNMIRAGYTRAFAVGLIATAGGLGILIPPSVPLIVYGIVTETSIGDLFLAGILPGLLTGILLVALVVFLAKRRNIGAGTLPMSRKERFGAIRDSALGVLLPILVLGGIYGGIFTPTEAAAMAVLYAFLISTFVYREIDFRALRDILVRSARTSAMVMFIIANAILFTFVLSLERIPAEIAEFLISLDLAPWMFLLVVNILFLIVGCFMDAIGAILILAPILYPIAMQLGVDPVHFGIIIVMNFEIGAITPPLGINLFVASGISRMPAMQVARAALPWAGVLLAGLVLVTYIPDIALLIPGPSGP